MSRVFNALHRGDLQRGLREATKEAEKVTAEITGANTEPVKRSAEVLKKRWRAVLSVRGGGEPAPPGAPPHAQTRTLVRSIGNRVVDGVRRVGSGLFTARLQEFGYEDRSGNQVPPHPHGRPAVELAAPEMVDVMVTEAQKRIAAGGR